MPKSKLIEQLAGGTLGDGFAAAVLQDPDLSRLAGELQTVPPGANMWLDAWRENRAPAGWLRPSAAAVNFFVERPDRAWERVSNGFAQLNGGGGPELKQYDQELAKFIALLKRLFDDFFHFLRDGALAGVALGVDACGSREIDRRFWSRADVWVDLRAGDARLDRIGREDRGSVFPSITLASPGALKATELAASPRTALEPLTQIRGNAGRPEFEHWKDAARAFQMTIFHDGMPANSVEALRRVRKILDEMRIEISKDETIHKAMARHIPYWRNL